MDQVEIDSFVNKFKLLRVAGYEASLTLNSKLGEVQISLNCKVGRNVPPPTSPLDWNLRKKVSPSRQLRRARRAAARETSYSETINLNCENSAAGDDVNRVDQCESSLDFNDMETGAEKVLNCGENAFKEDCSSNVANETEKVVKSMDEDTSNGISLIPLRKLKLRDDQIRKLITERFEAKKLMDKRITIHRDFEDGTMVRTDVLVKPP